MLCAKVQPAAHGAAGAMPVAHAAIPPLFAGDSAQRRCLWIGVAVVALRWPSRAMGSARDLVGRDPCDDMQSFCARFTRCRDE